MSRRVFYALIVGSLLFACGTALRVLAHQEGLQILLYYITLFVVGVIAATVRRGFLLGFALSFALAFVSLAVFSPEAVMDLSHASIALAFLTITVINSAIGGALSAVGGLVGKKIVKS